MALAAYGRSVYRRDVLELGVGTGRATRYLLRLARRYVGIDYAPDMLARARDALPHADIRALDMRNLRGLDDASFDCVVGFCNVLDAVSHGDRLVVLAEAYRVLRPGGTLMFSSHNRRHRDAGAPPALDRSRNPLRQLRHLARYALRKRNYLRLRAYRVYDEDYAVLNDSGHHYALLHYYTSRPAQRRQLTMAGFELVGAIARDGRPLPPEGDDSDTPDILYIARREGPGD